MRSPKKEQFSKSRKNSKYKVKNWSSYNEALRKRGNIEFMIASDLSKGWYENKPDKQKRGRPQEYSDLAIENFLKIRYLFNLKLRQTQGFIQYLFEKCGLKLKCPDYSSISRRCNKLGLSTSFVNKDEEFEYVCMDSTGIQTYTGNEWLENKHGKQCNRRIWKKLHILVDEKGRILANYMTGHKANDRSEVANLLQHVQAKEFLGDPGYDGENIYQLLRKRGIKPTIRPPNRSHIINFNDTKTARDIRHGG